SRAKGGPPFARGAHRKRGSSGYRWRSRVLCEPAAALRGSWHQPRTLQRIVVAGSAPAQSLISGYERLGVAVNHVWGMTETSPCGTTSQSSRRTAALGAELQRDHKTTQGRPIYGIDVKVAGEDGRELPRDGT